MTFTTPCDRCGGYRALTETPIRTATGRARLGLCSDCVGWYRERSQIVGAALAPIGAQTAPLLRPRPNAEPIPLPRLPAPPDLLPPEVRRLVREVDP